MNQHTPPVIKRFSKNVSIGGLRRRKKERGFLKCLSKDNTTKADPPRLTGPAICICQRIFLFNCSSFVFAPLEGINDD